MQTLDANSQNLQFPQLITCTHFFRYPFWMEPYKVSINIYYTVIQSPLSPVSQWYFLYFSGKCPKMASVSFRDGVWLWCQLKKRSLQRLELETIWIPELWRSDLQLSCGCNVAGKCDDSVGCHKILDSFGNVLLRQVSWFWVILKEKEKKLNIYIYMIWSDSILKVTSAGHICRPGYLSLFIVDV